MPRLRDEPIIPCCLHPETVERVRTYSKALVDAAARIGGHGMTEDEFWDSGLFYSAIERLRGSRAASTSVKKRFVQQVLALLQGQGLIAGWKSAETTDRHDFEVRVDDD